jgi:hypothetical protein
MGWFQNWLTMIREATAEGRRFTRVRVANVPLTDYSRFGVFCSEYTNAAGEDIRYLRRDDASGSSKLVRIHFDDDENFLGGELIEDPAVIVQHNCWRDAAWHRAVRRDDLPPKRTTGITSVHEARDALGKRLRELRTAVGLSGRALAVVVVATIQGQQAGERQADTDRRRHP